MLLSCFSRLQNFNIIWKFVNGIKQKLLGWRESFRRRAFLLIIGVGRAWHIDGRNTMSQHKVIQESQQCFYLWLYIVAILSILSLLIVVRQQQMLKLVIWFEKYLLNPLILHQLINFTMSVCTRLFIKLIIRLRILRSASLVPAHAIQVATLDAFWAKIIHFAGVVLVRRLKPIVPVREWTAQVAVRALRDGI